MSAWKPLVLGIVVSATWSGLVNADPISSSGHFNWVAYFAGQHGNAPAPAVNSPPAAPASMVMPTPVQVTQPTVSQPMASPVQSIVTNVPAASPPPVTQPSSPAPVSSGPADAFINMGTGPYPLQNLITTGNAQPWYNSSQISGLFGGQPTSAQIQSFDNTILQRVQQAFNQSGVSLKLTDDPSVAAHHTLSLVSGTSSSTLSGAIGMTQVGASGFSFIDKIAPSAQSLDQLEWIVAHNVSHELMLALGVPENYDQSGTYIDSKLASWSMMVNSSSTFSPAAAQALNQAIASQDSSPSSSSQLGAQIIGSDNSVPEPTTIALWTLAGAALIVARKRSTLQKRPMARAEA